MTIFDFTVLSLGFGALLVLCLASPALGLVFRNGVLRSLGRYSYCIYLLHPSVIEWTNLAIGHFYQRRLIVPGHIYTSHEMYALADMAVCYAVARLSWRWIEMPALQLKRHFRYSFTVSPKPEVPSISLLVPGDVR